MINDTSVANREHKACCTIRARLLVVGALAAILLLISRTVLAVGLDPVPIFTSAEIDALVQRETLPNPPPFGGTFDRYVYTYSVTNPSTNTGEIWYWKIDLVEPFRTRDIISPDLTLPQGTDTIGFDDYRNSIEPLFLRPGSSVVPIGQSVPLGWNGGFGRDGFLGFATATGTPNILPGQTLGGFEIRSRRLPSVREVHILPDWVLVVQDHDAVTDEELDQAADVEKSLRFNTFTLGPSASFQVGNFQHFNRIADEINKMIEIGWIDAATGANLLSELSQGRDAREQFDGTQAKVHLQNMFDIAAGLRAEARQLIQLNVETIIERTPDTPPPFIPPEPVLTLTPDRIELPIGSQYTLTLTSINAADNNQPFPEYQDALDVDLDFEVAEGPHAGFSDRSVTFNSLGEATFSYIGVREGLDVIHLTQEEDDSEVEVIREARVRWIGGPDLAVPLFIPPIIETEAGKTIFITDRTMNLGSLPAPPSVTRYFLSDVEPVDPNNALVIAERGVGALDPDQFSDASAQPITIPPGLAPGTYFMAACADANEEVIELNEDNNCSFSELEMIVSVIVPGVPPDNNSPDCSQAVASPDLLWPPNHKLVNIDITGITDPDGDPISLTITSIQQDEPVNGVADGDTSPDGFGVDTPQAQVRRERSGQGNGRIYEIGFNADDGQGNGGCSGSVLTGVPHDQGQGSTPIDDGVRFDSTQP